MNLPPYEDVQKFAGPVFVATLAFWITPERIIPAGLARFSPYAVAACYMSGAILVWGAGSRYLKHRQSAKKQEEDRLHRIRENLSEIAQLPVDLRKLLADIYETRERGAEVPFTEDGGSALQAMGFIEEIEEMTRGGYSLMRVPRRIRELLDEDPRALTWADE